MCSCSVASVMSDSLCVTLWTVPRQVPLSTGFSRQEYWSGLPFPPPGDLLDPGIEPMLPVSPVLAGMFFITEPPWKPETVSLYSLTVKNLNDTEMDIIKGDRHPGHFPFHSLPWVCSGTIKHHQTFAHVFPCLWDLALHISLHSITGFFFFLAIHLRNLSMQMPTNLFSPTGKRIYFVKTVKQTEGAKYSD